MKPRHTQKSFKKIEYIRKSWWVSVFFEDVQPQRCGEDDPVHELSQIRSMEVFRSKSAWKNVKTYSENA